jgi:tuberous sclerosis protein 2
MNHVIAQSNNLSRRSLLTMIDILNYSNFVSVYRGAVFFVGMAAWGKDQRELFDDCFGVVLSAMLKVVTCKNELVAYEIMLSIRRLVKKYGKELRTEWDDVIQILYQMNIYIEGTNKTSSLKDVLKDVLNELYGK